MSEWLAMGGYAAFVWPSYGLVAALMIYIAVQPLRAHRKLQRRLYARFRAKELQP
jgi:heme exporter protein D